MACGCASALSLKLATNTALRRKQQEDTCINCCDVIAGTANIDEMGERFVWLMSQTASRRATQGAGRGAGQRELVQWQLGAV